MCNDIIVLGEFAHPLRMNYTRITIRDELLFSSTNAYMYMYAFARSEFPKCSIVILEIFSSCGVNSFWALAIFIKQLGL